MSALPRLRIASDSEPLWIPASTAAMRAGYSSGHTRRLCQSLVRSGMARLEKLDNGQKGWIIREDADPKFAPVKEAAPIAGPDDITDLPEKVQEVIKFRKRILDLVDAKRVEWNREGKPFRAELKAYLQWLFDNEGVHGNNPAKPISDTNYYNWANAIKQGLRGLQDRRMASQGVDISEHPFVVECLRLWLTQQRREVTVCHQVACDKAEERGWEIIPCKTVQTFIFGWSKRNPTEVQRLRFGREAYENNSKPFIDRDYSTLVSNEQWCSDHHQFDVWVQISAAHEVTDPRTGELRQVPAQYARPWITAWMDMRSRKIVGHVITLAPSQDTIHLAFHRALVTHGVPEETYVDNGKDYDAWSLQGITKVQRRRLKLTYDAAGMQGLFGVLKVKTVHCEPFHGQSKPIERYFRTVKNRFCKLYDTYCGGRPDERPDNCFEQLKSGKGPSLDVFTADYERWQENDYHQRVHRGDSMAMPPAQAWEQFLVQKVMVNPRTAELLKYRPVKPSPVGQGGEVTWMKQRYKATELLRRIGEEIYLRFDPDNVNDISIWTLKNEFICFASPKERIPANAAKYGIIQDALREIRSDARVQRQMSEVRTRSGRSVAQRALATAIRQADQTRANAPTLPPAPLRIARTAIDDQLEVYEQRRELRKAVGDGIGHRSGPSLDELESIYGGRE